MIEFTKSFTVGDRAFTKLGDAQLFELSEMLLGAEGEHMGEPEATRIAGYIMAQSDRIVDILTTKGSSRPKARKINKKKATANENHTKP